eukprot:TRINITY_DN8656_c0_g1_i1.p1 TRINITY_DN8656_c0_g1~~TRINITY_DN8656_c0_g1_i1.p1  ORF type:complete len:346 (-),score=86.13 TRINITY_DN8656_c0_g1_i1:48-1085(-)
MLWVDQYRPKQFSELTFHNETTEKLKKMVSKGNFPHLLFYGPPGGGKKTRIQCLLREVYPSNVEKLKIEHRTFKPSSKEIEITTLSSNYHIEMNPTDVGHHDKHVIQEILKEIAQSGSVSNVPFKVVVLNEVDKLTKEAQQALRRTMEKFSANCRLVLCANSTCQVIEAIRSRCLLIRVPSPTVEEISSVLETVCNKKGIKISPSYAEKIAINSDQNLRRAILMLQSAYTHQYPFNESLVAKTDWEKIVTEIARSITSEQNPNALLNIRNQFYELLSRCIPAETILRNLVFSLLSLTDNNLKHEIVKHSSFYDHRLKIGSKAIFHLEAFVCKVMVLCKESSINTK